MNYLKKLALCALGLVGLSGLARADVEADVTAIATSATTVFGTVTTLVISITLFGILIFIIRKIRGR